MTLKEFKLKVFSEAIKNFGKLTIEDHAKARINKCKTLEDGKPCRYHGEVNPVPSLKLEGCTKCGCPFATKPFMLTFMGLKVECPHPEGNQWAEIDEDFLKTK